MKKKRTISDLCQEFHLTEMEVQRFMKEGALAFTFLKGREIVFTDRQVKAFKPACFKYKMEKFKKMDQQTLKKTRQEMKSALPPLPRPPLKIEKIEPQPQPQPEAIKVELIKPGEPEKAIRNEDVIPVVDESKELDSIIDPCEWNPEKSEPTESKKLSHAEATWIVGAKGQWRLCDKCVELPEFKRYRVRKRIE